MLIVVGVNIRRKRHIIASNAYYGCGSVVDFNDAPLLHGHVYARGILRYSRACEHKTILEIHEQSNQYEFHAWNLFTF